MSEGVAGVPLHFPEHEAAAVRGRLDQPSDGILMVVEYIFRAPTGTPADLGASPPRYRREDGPDGMIIECDVAVPVRGGVTVYADVFRAPAGRPAPVLVAWPPYGKHAGPQLPERYPDGGVAPGQLSAYTAFESPDPVHWTARGYAVVNADIPGTWNCGGDATFLSPEEAWCGHDLIEWAGTRFGPGETLRLVIQGRDVYRYPRPLIQALHEESVNRGAHVVHAGGEYDSHLLVPVAPFTTTRPESSGTSAPMSDEGRNDGTAR
jgi:predicted acyl esterase